MAGNVPLSNALLPKRGRAAGVLRRGAAGLCLLAAGTLAGCGVPQGEIFPPLANAPRWPAPPDAPRITYVGKIETDHDLKAAVSGWDAFNQAVFGKADAHSMLSPLALCTDGADRLFVADSNAQTVHVFDFKARAYATWSPGKNQPPFAQPVAVAWNPTRGQLLVSDSAAAAVVIFDATGHCLGHLGEGGSGDQAEQVFERPVGIAVDTSAAHAGRILVADSKLHQILVFSPEGRLQQHLGRRGGGPVEFNFPTYLAISPAGLVYVSDSLNFRVQELDADLHFRRAFGRKGDLPGYFAQPKGVATDSQGHLYVVDAQFENVQLFDDQGRVLMDFGEEGRAPGQFWLPNGICIDAHNRIYIADSYNRRIQVFDFIPQPEDAP